MLHLLSFLLLPDMPVNAGKTILQIREHLKAAQTKNSVTRISGKRYYPLAASTSGSHERVATELRMSYVFLQHDTLFVIAETLNFLEEF